MRSFISFLVVAAMIFSVATVTSCKKDEEKTFTVTFNSNGGSAVEAKTVKKGDKVAEPLAPTLDTDKPYFNTICVIWHVVKYPVNNLICSIYRHFSRTIMLLITVTTT